MFIRKKANKGGSFSIMLVMGERNTGKKHSTLRVIRNFGCATDEASLNELMQEAQRYKEHLMSVSPKAKTLKITSAADIQSCRSFNVGFRDVYGELFHTIFGRLNLKLADLKKLHDLIVMRIALPASKRKTAMLSHEYGMECQVDSIFYPSPD